MSWVNISDDFADHPKFIDLSNDALALWVRALAYTKRHLTDGFIPSGAVRRLANHPKPDRLAAELVRARLWDPEGDAFRFHNYLRWNDSKADVERKIADAKARKERWRDKRTGEYSQHSETQEERVPGRVRNDAATRSERPPKPNQTKPNQEEILPGSFTPPFQTENPLGGGGDVAALREAIAGALKAPVFAFLEPRGAIPGMVEALALRAVEAGKSPAEVTDALKHLATKAAAGWAPNRIEGALSRAVQFAEIPRLAVSGPRRRTHLQPSAAEFGETGGYDVD